MNKWGASIFISRNSLTFDLLCISLLSVFAFGDEVGYGFHSDFVNGWNTDILQRAVDQCTGDLFSNVESMAS